MTRLYIAMALLTATFSGNCPVYVAQAPVPVAKNEFQLLPCGKSTDSALCDLIAATLSSACRKTHYAGQNQCGCLVVNTPKELASWAVQSPFKVTHEEAINSLEAKTSPFLLPGTVVRPDLMIAQLI